jgi:hypothetical protein
MRTPRSLFCAFLLGLAVASAQTPQASISGVVTDAQGAVIAGADVVATSAATSVKFSARTNDSGFYSIPFLPIGDYTVTVERSGFRRSVRQGVALSTGQVLALDIQLELGAVSESINVSATPSLIETRTSDVSQLVESKTVEDMPLGDRRALNVIRISGAAVFVNYDTGLKPNFSLAGGRTQSQMFWIDGGTGQNMRLGVGQVDLEPPADAVSEVKILSNNYAAEYGGSAGGVIIATTKSGTNQFHGSLEEYLRNDKLDAANFFAPTSGDQKIKAPLRYNVFGGTAGGPIRHDKTFFFASYEGSRRHDGSNRSLTVPTDLQKAGDFSQTVTAQGALIPVYDPATTRVDSTGKTIRDLFPGNRIPSSGLDPVALNIMKFYPAPNRPPDNLSGANNFRGNYVTLLHRDNILGKVDHNFRSKDKFSARYMFNSDNMTNTSVFPTAAADTLNDALRHQNYFYGSWTRIIGPSLINEFRYTYSNRINHASSPSVGGDWPSKLGIKGVPENAFPQIIATGFTNLSNATQERRQYPIQQHQYVDSLSWIRGRHALKFGFEARPGYNYEVNLPTGSGAFTFGTQPTGLPGNAATGFGLATMLVGFPTAFTLRQTEVLDRHSWYLAGYAQDDWTVNNRLTLNIGVRWETDTPIIDIHNRMNGFDLHAINPVSGTPGVVRFAGVDGFPSNPYHIDWNNFGPRFGFAWKPGGEKTVVRGGFGISFAHPFDSGQPSSGSLGFELSASLTTPDNGITAPFYLRNGVPVNATAPQLDASYGAVKLGQNATTAVTYFDPDRATGYSQQFNLGVQHELGGAMFVEVSYIGNLSRKLASANLNINQILPQILGPNASTQKDRPYPQFSNVTIIAPTLGVSSYHAGMARFEKRFSHGLSVLATYTFSKFLDNANEAGSALGNEGGAYSNYYNRRPDYGPSENDIRHRFVWSSVYEIPYRPKNPLRYLLSDWVAGSLITLQSGPPFTVNTQTNTTNSFSAGSLRADVLRNPNLPAGQRTLDHWFDTDAFRQPALYQFGNQAKDILRSDGLVNFDVSLSRNFPVGEKKKFQFRGEFFNLFNHPSFGTPGQNLGGPGFGVVSTASPGRTIQLGARFAF